MLRVGVRIIAVALFVTACSASDDSEDAAPTTTTETTATSTTIGTTTTVEVSCDGLGDVAPDGDITWVADGVLMTGSTCLTDLGSDVPITGWGGRGDRVVVDDRVLSTVGALETPFEEGPLVLSRPTGTAVLHVTEEGQLLKRDLDGSAVRDISFMAHHEAAAYHPAGRHIVSSGTDAEGAPLLLIADNEGRDPLPLLRFEDANAVGDPTFTADGELLYTAVHPDHVDLHRLELGADVFGTIATVPKPATITDVTASPFVDAQIAWTEGDCTAARPRLLRAEPEGVLGAGAAGLPTDVLEDSEPVGWLPDGGLVLIDRDGCDRDAAGTLLVVRGGDVETVADGVTSAAVRAELPPPTPPPRDIPSEAPA